MTGNVAQTVLGSMTIQEAEVELPSSDLHTDMAFFTKELGFQLENIHPSDDPVVAVLSGYGLRIRLDRHSQQSPGAIRLNIAATNDAVDFESGAVTPSELMAPNGTTIILQSVVEAAVIPPTQHSFQTRRLADSDAWVVGRAGMLYRDLIEDRLGGSIIASHIRIPNGGPVPDMVHYHTIGFQLIYCLSGWVRLVYEDQGPPFILNAGDCVTQPPKIRHRVLESSDNLEVLEIGVPAEHMTTIDHSLELPTKTHRPDREFDGQTFCHSRVSDALWTKSRLPGFDCRETGINVSTANLASVQVIRPEASSGGDDNIGASPLQMLEKVVSSHDADILFVFVANGSLVLEVQENREAVAYPLGKGDAFVIPPQMMTSITERSNGLELIEISLPGNIVTRLQ